MTEPFLYFILFNFQLFSELLLKTPDFLSTLKPCLFRNLSKAEKMRTHILILSHFSSNYIKKFKVNRCLAVKDIFEFQNIYKTALRNNGCICLMVASIQYYQFLGFIIDKTLRDHPLSRYAKFFEKLTFLTP